MRFDERGSVGLWMLGLGLLLLTLGGIAIDLWALLGDRRELAAIADAAATAAVAGIDESVWRAEGVVRLDPALAQDRAEALIDRQPAAYGLVYPPDWFMVLPEQLSVVVTLQRPVDLTLLRLTGTPSIVVGASGRARAERR